MKNNLLAGFLLWCALIPSNALAQGGTNDACTNTFFTRFKEDFRIRQTHEELVKDLSDSEAATVGFDRNYEDDQSSWSFIGAIGFVTRFPRNNDDYDFSDPTSIRLRQWYFVPSASFDRVTGGPENEQTDSLVFRTGWAGTFLRAEENKQQWWRSHRLSISPVYSTDFDFRSSQLGGEINWEPGLTQPGNHPCFGLGAFLPLITDKVDYRATFSVHLEGGYTFDAGKNSDLVEGTAYFRAGPDIGIDLRLSRPEAGEPIKLLQRLMLFATWQDYEALISDVRSTRLFQTGASWMLDDNEHFSLTLKYRKGRIPLTAEKVDALNLSLGLSF